MGGACERERAIRGCDGRKTQDCEIQNVVANVVIPGSTPDIPSDARLNINAMLVHLNANVKEPVCQYRKFLFPGLVYRPPNSPVVVLCFSSGKCVVTGGRTVEVSVPPPPPLF